MKCSRASFLLGEHISLLTVVYLVNYEVTQAERRNLGERAGSVERSVAERSGAEWSGAE